MKHYRFVFWAIGLGLICTGLIFTPELLAQDETGGRSLFQIIKDGKFVGLVIILISLVAVALVMEHFFSIRRSRLTPPALIQTVETQLNENQLQAAKDTCEADGSMLANIIKAGLDQTGSMFGFYDMQTAMQEAGEREVSKLYRKLEYLSFIAATAPMLGLLGTVIGMIGAFGTISQADSSSGALASDISGALVTTAMGLIVSIPTMFFVSFFKNRIDSNVAEAETTVDKLTARFKQAKL